MICCLKTNAPRKFEKCRGRIDANTHALALLFTLKDLLEVAGIWIDLERPDHKYVNNFGLAWQANAIMLPYYMKLRRHVIKTNLVNSS